MARRGMQPAIGPDRRGARAGAQEVADRRGRLIVALEIPTAGLGADRAAAIVEKGGPVGTPEPRIVGDVDAQARLRTQLGEAVIDPVALVVADEDGIAKAAPADVDPARRVWLVAAEHALVRRMRHGQHGGAGIVVE